MNWMALIAIISALTATVALCAARYHANRAANLTTQIVGLHVEKSRLRRVMDEFVEAADAMNDCNAEMERRNAWLEQRRQVILQRWWRRPSQRRRLVAWQVRKGDGA